MADRAAAAPRSPHLQVGEVHALGNTDDDNDGCWRSHSWLVDDNGDVIETTVGRRAYFGVVLNGDESDDFVFWNA